MGREVSSTSVSIPTVLLVYLLLVLPCTTVVVLVYDISFLSLNFFIFPIL